MRNLLEHWGEIPEFKRTIEYIRGGGTSILLRGADKIHKIHAAACIRYVTDRPLVIICANEIGAGQFARDLEIFLEERVSVLCHRDFTFYNAEGVSRQMEQSRIKTFSEMQGGGISALVATVPSLMQRSISIKALSELSIEIVSGQEISIKLVIQKLIDAGYSRTDQVEGSGQFASRGGILDFYSPAFDLPVRCEFWGDEIDTLSFFDPVTQRRGERVERAAIIPVSETSITPGEKERVIKGLMEYCKKLGRRKNKSEKFVENLLGDIEKLESGAAVSGLDKYMDIIYPDFTTAADFIPEGAIVVVDEPADLVVRGESFLWQMGEDIKSLLESEILEGSISNFVVRWPEACEKIRGRQTVLTQNFSGSKGLDGATFNAPNTIIDLKAKQLSSFGSSLETAAGDIRHYTSVGMRVIALCNDERRARLLGENLLEAGLKLALDFDIKNLPDKGKCLITRGTLTSGIEYTSAGLIVITEGFVVKTAPRKVKRDKTRQRLTSYADLSPGDLVVHEQHGIGRFEGIFPISVDGGKKDYIKIMYHGGDTLYVPATNLDLVSKYIGSTGAAGAGENRTAKLSKMGGADWVKAKNKAKGAAKDLAKGLIELYSQRQRIKGHAFSKDSVWQSDFEEEFEYELTDDQAASVSEIKADMEKSAPMDRLLCGDVGYGKTEVAMRAVMKCVLDGKQAAILVPTTVLAQQHYQTAIERFVKFPVKTEVLSRFKSPAKIKEAAAAIERGDIDIVIGTHKLLQKDIKFKDMGLLIVDEEQRFGVSHKERLKEISKNVDALTLSATPIPRTLNMAMTGIRDMSTIQEPPQDRHPVQTYVLEHDWGIVADAIRREVSRGGQVYYLHNRVENIENTAGKIKKLVPGINVATAHGKMNEVVLNKVMDAMTSGDTQVLVCTTIIETGIDIPNVNTLIIEDADKFGLAQLHQIRGRVGRSSRHAFAYLTYRQGKILTEVASKRLSAIREFAEFNSGFKIAMRDLEIRGTGNLLGAEQSGHMVSVGYEMYLKLLEEAVSEVRGEKKEVPRECSMDITVSANIPESYVPSPEQRMDLYREIARIRNREDAEDMLDGLIDRYGDPPESVQNLISVARMRGMAAELNIVDITQKGGFLEFKFQDFNMEQISAIYPSFKGRMKVMAGSVPIIEIKMKKGETAVDAVMSFLGAYGESGKDSQR